MTTRQKQRLARIKERYIKEGYKLGYRKALQSKKPLNESWGLSDEFEKKAMEFYKLVDAQMDEQKQYPRIVAKLRAIRKSIADCVGLSDKANSAYFDKQYGTSYKRR